MNDLIQELSLQLAGAIQGSVPPENFRQWLMSSMLEFESCDNEELIDLVFSLELLGFEFQGGYRSSGSYIEGIRNTVDSSPLASRLRTSNQFVFNEPDQVEEIRQGSVPVGNGSVRQNVGRVTKILFEGTSSFSQRFHGMLTFGTGS